MARSKIKDHKQNFDPELDDLPDGARWREWMMRVEAVIFAAKDPVPRETLAKLVGKTCRLDDLIADIKADLRARPYELSFIAGGYRLHTKARFSTAIRAALKTDAPDPGPRKLTQTELLTLTAIAYLQPATRADISNLAGKEISRDTIAALKNYGLIDGALRAPSPGAPFAYVTTKKFLELFGLGSLRDLPDLDDFERDRILPEQKTDADRELDAILGLMDDESQEQDLDDAETNFGADEDDEVEE